MTDSIAPEWTDERLAAAFGTRAAGQAAPAGLVTTTMSRVRPMSPSRPASRRLAWATAIGAAALAVAFLYGTLVTIGGPVGPDATAAPHSGAVASLRTVTASASPRPRLIRIEFPVGARTMIVEVLDRSGRLVRATAVPRDLSPGRPLPLVHATSIDGRPEQVRVDWLGSACDPPTVMTIGQGARTIEFTTTDEVTDTGSFCMLGGNPRGVLLTFDGPVRAEDIEFVGQPPGPVWQPLEALGLPVISVEEALRHRGEALDDTELAVFGYWYRQPVMSSCPLVIDVSPIVPYCNERRLWLTSQPAQLTPENAQARNPALQPMLRNAVSMLDGGTSNGDPILLVGHFDDHRAAICTGDIASACRESFVVDVVLDPSDPTLDLERVEHDASGADLDLQSTAEHAERAATEAPRGARQIVAAVAVAGADLDSYEPQILGTPELVDAPAVWVVRWIDRDPGGRPVVRTRLVIDGPVDDLASQVYEVTSSGVAKVGAS